MEPATNGCKDGPTPLLVQNHSDSVQQDKKASEKHSTKAAATAEASTVRAARHVTNSKSTSKKSSAAASGRKSPATKGDADGGSSGSRRTPRTNSTPGPGRPPKAAAAQREATRRPAPEASAVAATPPSMSASSLPMDTNPRRARKRESPRSPSGNSDTSGRASKRMRLQYQPFQSPGTLPTLVVRTRGSGAGVTPAPPEDKVIVFHKGEFIGVRNETGSFYVCRAAQNVYKSSKRFKIQWMNNDSEPDIYAPDFYDNTDFECVLTNLRLRRVDRGRYLLPDEERKRTLNILQRSLNVENGMDIPDPRQLTMDGVDVSFVGKEEEEELSEVPPTTLSGRGRPRTVHRDADNSDNSDSDADARPAKGSKGRSQAARSAKPKGKRGPKPNSSAPTELLRPNTKVSLLDKDPFFESSDTPASVSVLADSKLLIRAVLRGDHVLLKGLLEEKNRICAVGLVRSVDVELSALDYAVIREDHRAVQLLLEAPLDHLASAPTNMLLHEGPNFSSVCPATLNSSSLNLAVPPEVAQGANGVLVLDEGHCQRGQTPNRKRAVLLAVRRGVSLETVELLLNSLKEEEEEEQTGTLVVEALRHGHPKLAGALMDRVGRRSVSGLPPLHRQVLSDGRESLSLFRPTLVLQKAFGCHEVTPLHCAAVNPERCYLAELLGSLPCVEVQDGRGWRPLHYAAVATSTATLELLLARGASVHPVDSVGDTPLHKAAEAGRPHNVELLLRSASGIEKGGGTRNVDVPNKDGWTPLHLAARNGHLEAAQVLTRFKADVGRTPGASCGRITPLMLAAQQGSCDMVQLLVDAGAQVEFQDKSGRTALSHAVLNGQTRVCAQLLRLGCSHNRTDSQGNTLVHYAAAYGWLSCLKVLLDAGAAPHKANEAKATPILVAFLRGHMGVVDLLLEQPGVILNADTPDDPLGRTLVMRAIRTRLDASIYTRLQFLLEKSKSDATRVDQDGNNALHHLAMADSEFRERQRQQELGDIDDMEDQRICPQREREEHERCLEKATALLLSSGCDPATLNKDQQSPLSLALCKGSLVLVQQLLESGCQPDSEALSAASGLLHQVALLARTRDVLPLLKALLKQPQCTEEQRPEARSTRDVLRQAANGHDRDGLTPLLLTLRTLGGLEKSDAAEGPKSYLVALLRLLLEELGADAAAAVRGGRGPSALHLAAQCSGAEAVELLLQHKPLLEPLDADGLTPLARALALRNCAAVRALVSAGASVNVDLRDGPHLVSLLIYTAMNNLPGDLIQLLLKHKAMPKATHPLTGNTALHYAVTFRSNPECLDTVRALLDAGLDVNGPNARGRTALHLAANASTGTVDSNTALEELLLQRGARADVQDVRGRVPLHYAFVKIHRHWDSAPCDPLDLTTLLLAHQSAVAELQDEFGQTPLHYAATRGASVCAFTLCQKMKSVDVKDKNGNTPLGLAVLHGHSGCCMMLIQKGANSTADLCILPDTQKVPTATGAWCWRYLLPKPVVTQHVPILQEVVKRSWQGILNLMLDQLETFGKNLTLAVEVALRTRSYGLALRLISKVKHGWTLYSDKQTMLHLLAREAPCDSHQEIQKRVAQALMDKGVPVMARDEHGCSVLTYAAINWNHTLCEFFSDKMGMVAAACADPDRSLRTPFSAVFWRLQEGPLPTPIQSWCLSLVKAGATADLLTCYPLRNLEFPGTICLSEEERLHVEGPTAARLSPLILAVCKRNYAVVKMLLKAGVDANFADGQQRTALMYAVKLNDTKMAKLLLNNNYDPNSDLDPYGDIRQTNFKKTSAVDLAHQDIYGWTALHHVVAPLPDCTYACPAMLQLLAHAGAPLDTPDLNNVTPLHLAAARGVGILTLALQALLKVTTYQMPKVALHNLPLAVDSLEPPPEKPNYEEHCKAFLARGQEHGQEQGQEPLPPQREPNLEPDPLARMDDGEVIMDKAQNIPYDVLLTAVDLTYGQLGLYTFYKMQLLQQTGTVVLFSRWGRVGDSGQWCRLAFPSLQDATQEFARLFHSKTGNSWEDLQSFKAQWRKYRPVQLEKRRGPPPRDLPVNLSSPCQSRLPPPLQQLLRNLADPELLCSGPLTLRAQGQVALELLSRESLYTALALLEDLHRLVQEKASLQAKAEQQHHQESKLPELMLRIIEKSEEFYCLIPVRGRQFERLEPLFDERGIDNQAALVHSLLHLQLAYQIVLGAQLKAAELHPLDYIYHSLGCKLQLLAEQIPETQTILQYVHNSAEAPPRVTAVMRVTREKELERLAGCEIDNHWLLWHATDAWNILGILASGLEAQPLTEHWTGDPMAKGIRLSDRFETGRKLCESGLRGSKGSKYMFLCEVALGRTKDLDLGPSGNTEPASPGGHESIRALGRWQPHPLGTVSWHSCTVPLGPSNKAEPQQSPLSYNEYVVYKSAQVCLRYLVEFED